MQVLQRALSEIAGRQDNVITWHQLLDAGLGRGAITHRVAHGYMQRMYRGVYLLGAAPPTHRARARAALFAAGAGAVISHRTAAELWSLLPETTNIHITVPGRNPGSWPGIRVHRTAELPAEHLRTV